MKSEKNILKESFLNTTDLNQTVFCLECVLKYHTPFALYIATADRSDCSWIFDVDTVYGMLGGKDKYKQIFSSTQLENLEQDNQEPQTMFFIFRKVGPIYAIKISLETIEEIVNELYEEI
jgi:hypothetical protein